MIIKTGWQNDFGKEKFDIELNETDLAGSSLTPASPRTPQLRLEESEEMLRLAAQYFCLRQRAMVDRSTAVTSGRTKRLNEHLNDRLDQVKARLGVDQRGAA